MSGFTSAANADIIKKFLQSYKNNEKYPFIDKIDQMYGDNKFVFTMSYDDLIQTEKSNLETISKEENIPSETDQFLDILNIKTKEFLENAKEATLAIIRERHNNLTDELVEKLVVQINDSPQRLEIPEVRPSYIKKFLGFEGIISLLDENPSTFFKKKVFKCTNCEAVTETNAQGLWIPKPKKCPACGEKILIEEEEESAKYAVNYKRMELQQLPERVEADRVASSIECWLIGDDLAKKAIAGDRVKITGFLKTKPKEIGSTALGEYYIEVNYLQSINNIETETLDKYQTQLQFLMNEQNEDEIFNKLVESVCPSVKGLRSVKLALLLQGVGAEPKIIQGGTRIRGDINVLLAGNPGTAKSTFARWMKKTAFRAVYASNISTRVGLAAAVIADKKGGFRIQPGAYMIGKYVIVDEFEKTPEEDRLYLPNIMDDTQTLSINKGGISKEFKVKTTSLHICNPEGGKWDNEKTFAENIPLAFWLFDRYDVKFVLRGVDLETNKAISSHFIDSLFNSISEKEYETGGKDIPYSGDVYPLEFMREYYAYCKKNFDPDPKVSPSAYEKIQTIKQKLHEFYINLKVSKYTEDISAREIGVIFRLSMASARAHMRNYLKEKDIDIAIQLIKDSMLSCGMNEIGNLDMNQWNGISPSDPKADKIKKIERKRVLKAVINRLSNNGIEYFRRDDLEVETRRAIDITTMELTPLIDEFISLGLLSEPPGMKGMLNRTKAMDKLNI